MVPAETPTTSPVVPVPEPIVATAVLLLVHVPPVVASLSEVVVVAQRLAVPDIAAGKGFTVTVTVL